MGQIGSTLVLLGNRPKIMDRLLKEIDSVVPRDRLPCLNDKSNLPYVQATILEVLRYRIVAPFGSPHATAINTEVGGYHIPKDIKVITNLWSAHMDPEVWTDPDTFRPERFFDENDNIIINQDLMIAFSLGKRACLGEQLARQELFLILAGILQQFNILPPEGQPHITEEMRVVQTIVPAPYELRLIPR